MKKNKIIIGAMIITGLAGTVNALNYHTPSRDWIVTNTKILVSTPSTNWSKNKITGRIKMKTPSTNWHLDKNGNSFYQTPSTTLEKKGDYIKYKTPSTLFIKDGDKISYITPSTTLEIENGKIKYITPSTTKIIDGDKFEYTTPSKSYKK